MPQRRFKCTLACGEHAPRGFEYLQHVMLMMLTLYHRCHTAATNKKPKPPTLRDNTTHDGRNHETTITQRFSARMEVTKTNQPANMLGMAMLAMATICSIRKFA